MNTSETSDAELWFDAWTADLKLVRQARDLAKVSIASKRLNAVMDQFYVTTADAAKSAAAFAAALQKSRTR